MVQKDGSDGYCLMKWSTSFFNRFTLFI